MRIRLAADGRAMRAITHPLVRTADHERAKQSFWHWRINTEQIAGDGPVRYTQVYELTPLGILHRLINLEVEAK